MFKKGFALFLISFLPLLAACVNKTNVRFPHIHGLGFSADGSQLVVPAHDGLRFYSEGNWQIPDVPVRDYMGYSAVDFGFYSSGHPGPGSSETNPLGLVMSSDNGETLSHLGFEGESDFHLMGVGYSNHALYVVNQYPNPRMGEGLYYSLDNGESWQNPAAKGLTTFPWQIAVHPNQPGTIALATESGLFWSEDFGDSFILVSDSGPVTSAAFDPGGSRLLFASSGLWQYEISSREIQDIGLPPLSTDEFVLYIAASLSGQLAVSTTELNIYISGDGGASWKQIADQGQGV